MHSREVLARLHADGWPIKRQRGSHVQLVHPVKHGKTTVPHPLKSISAGTLRSIERQSGLRLRRSAP
ncbi:MAG: addiction module toxin, HicA family [Gemmatimonas sp.]|nr:addiction module toxin, HicA family [Gemmatimonas sp.]